MMPRQGKPMSETEANYLELFPAWLRSLDDDAEALGAIAADTSASEAARALVAGGLNYVFKSLDLIPDGIDDIGYLDDAFVLRVAADRALHEDVSDLDPDKLRTLNRLSADAEVIHAFLGEEYPRLDDYVVSLRKTPARGRSVKDILADEPTQRAFLADIRGFAQSYEPPAFERDEKNLVKLRAFFEAKLPK
jgi:uncharacterized membrane protein YkvA (DUF1232 family)